MRTLQKRRWIYLLFALGTLASGLFLIRYGSLVPALRGSAGDLLVVVFIYAVFRILLPYGTPLKLGAAVFLFATFLEGLQYLKILDLLGIENRWIARILGTTFDPFDILLYALGVTTVVLFDRHISGGRDGESIREL